MDARRRLSSHYSAGPRNHKPAARTALMITALVVALILIPACAALPEGEALAAAQREPGGPVEADRAAAPSLGAGPLIPEASRAAVEPMRSPTERPYWPQSQTSRPGAHRRTAAATPPSPVPARSPSREGAQGDKASSAGQPEAAESEGGVLPVPASSRGAPSGRTFAYEADRVYEVVTAPLRVTVVTLAPGETVVSRASGDTLRWQIGETRSGSGATERVHVLLKPLERGLTTNLVLATSGRLYLLALKSGAPDAFDPTVAWTYAPERSANAAPSQRPMDGRYRIAPQGRAPRWTPLAVLTDGVRTEIIFPDDLASAEAPVLIGRQSDGAPRLLSYRQAGSRYLVDEVIEDAELRLGGLHPRVVRIRRMAGAPR